MSEEVKKQFEMTAEEILERASEIMGVQTSGLLEALEVAMPLVSTAVAFYRDTSHMKVTFDVASRNTTDKDKLNFALNRIYMAVLDFRNTVEKNENLQARNQWENAREATPEERKLAEEAVFGKSTEE